MKNSKAETDAQRIAILEAALERMIDTAVDVGAKNRRESDARIAELEARIASLEASQAWKQL